MEKVERAIWGRKNGFRSDEQIMVAKILQWSSVNLFTNKNKLSIVFATHLGPHYDLHEAAGAQEPQNKSSDLKIEYCPFILFVIIIT